MSVTGGRICLSRKTEWLAREMAIKRTIVPVFKIEPLLRVDVDHDGRSRIFRQLIRLTRNAVYACLD